MKDDKVLVSWKEFSDQTPGVAQWIIQYRHENGSHDEEHNITLAAKVTNYTLTGDYFKLTNCDDFIISYNAMLVGKFF